MRFLPTFWGDHDFEALFRFRPLSILDVCTGNQRGTSLLLSVVRSALFIIEIAYVEEGGLGGNRQILMEGSP
jgi:hypothetical protein